MLDWIKKFFSGIGFGDLLNGIGSIIGNVINTKNVEKTNATNMQIAQEANAAQAAESEKAYERSKAGNQVNLMMQAGMSRAGAINALNGGGSYTPAPVNTAQAQSPQVDTSFLQSIASNALQAKVAEDSLHQQNEQFKMEHDLKERQFAEEQVNNKVARELTGKEIEIAAERLHLTEAQTKKVLADTDLTVAQLQTEVAKYGLTMAQIVQVQEQTKLTTAQILQVKAATKLTEQQVKTEFERTGLTHQQAETAAKEFVRLSQEVDEFMSLSAVDQRERAREYESQILRYTRDMKMNERDISNFERSLDKSVVGYVCNLWSYVASHVVPLKGLVNLKSN